MKSRPAVGFGLLAFSLAGCPQPQIARPYPAPTAAELRASIEAHRKSVSSLRTEAKVDYLAEKSDRIKVTMTFLVAAPDHLRIEAESPLGGSVASLASDGKRFQLVDVRGNRFLTGEARPCNIARLIRVALDPADVVAVIDGGAPLLDGAEESASWDGSDGGREVLTQKKKGGEVETIKLSSKDRHWDVVEAELKGADGKVVWRVEHADFSDAGDGARLPDRTTITQPSRNADARVRYKTHELNVTPPDGAFSLSAPPGLPIENVGCE